jgi:hypothetical protein
VRFRLYELGPDPPLPELDRLLVAPLILQVAEADDRRAHEATALLPYRSQQEANDVRLEDNVVIQEERKRRLALLEEELTMLGHAQSRQAAVQLHLMAVEAEQPQHRRHLGRGQRVDAFALVGGDDSKVPVGLLAQTRKRDSQAAGRSKVGMRTSSSGIGYSGFESEEYGLVVYASLRRRLTHGQDVSRIGMTMTSGTTVSSGCVRTKRTVSATLCGSWRTPGSISGKRSRRKGVRMPPAMTAVTLMPLGRNSECRAWLRPSSPHLLAW